MRRLPGCLVCALAAAEANLDRKCQRLARSNFLSMFQSVGRPDTSVSVVRKIVYGEGGMRLSKFKITNYRNILDSGWIITTKITAFVGQNEAGKSNLFEALYCINPYSGEQRATKSA